MAYGQLNLARKWRSQTFAEIVGQPLVVSMLQNSLYSGHIFPVYLLSGQRGCGKTSTARVFSAALNCEKLEQFRQMPKEQLLPCLTCQSCKAMQAGNHPDVIEMDAASHTGVDNVRQIIEAASFMPLLGTRKVYLIDEAHMLSKAAFNALLKILEEPPASVVFLLATTDPHKIIETVTSRCFRLFFAPIDATIIESHLEKICIKESIAYEHEALKVIVHESEGSLRDAINLLEQVRFASQVVAKKEVQRVLGHLDDERLLELLSTVLQGDPAVLIALLDTLSLAQYSASFIWQSSIALLRAALWHTCTVPAQAYAAEGARLVRVTGISTAMLIKVLKLLYDQERLFLKTTAQHGMLEMTLIDICATMNAPIERVQKAHIKGATSAPISAEPSTAPVSTNQEAGSDNKDTHWQQFILSLQNGGYDPLIVSLFTQGHCKRYDVQTQTLEVLFPPSFEMFQDMMINASAVWQPLLEQAFGTRVILKEIYTLEGQQVAAPPIKQPVPVQIPQKQIQSTKAEVKTAYKGQAASSSGSRMQPVKQNGKKVDISDTQKWQKAHELIEAFDGIVTEEEEV